MNANTDPNENVRKAAQQAVELLRGFLRQQQHTCALLGLAHDEAVYGAILALCDCLGEIVRKGIGTEAERRDAVEAIHYRISRAASATDVPPL